MGITILPCLALPPFTALRICAFITMESMQGFQEVNPPSLAVLTPARFSANFA